jgi:hypothetical protein
LLITGRAGTPADDGESGVALASGRLVGISVPGISVAGAGVAMPGMEHPKTANISTAEMDKIFKVIDLGCMLPPNLRNFSPGMEKDGGFKFIKSLKHPIRNSLYVD